MKIKQLHIYTKNLQEQKRFYAEVLELPVRQIGTNMIQVLLGFSEIFIEEKSTAKPYHIAFHIMPNKIEQAQHWLSDKVECLTFEGNPIIEFPAWNARSLYFYDENKNIVEFISRKDLFPKTEKNFDAEQILGIAEVGLVTEDVNFGSITADISAYIADECFTYLDAPIKRLSSLDTPIPFAQPLENQYLAKRKLAEAIEALLAY